jgi:integrase
MPLTDTAIRNLKPADKPFRTFDGGGLYLEISPTGGKLWRLKYRFNGKEKRLALGAYPIVSLKDARTRRDEAKKLLANEIDPGAAKKAKKTARFDRAANSFEIVAREWFEKWKVDKVKGHSCRVMVRLEQNVFPWMGGKPIAEVNAPDTLAVLRRVENRGAVETARRIKEHISQIMRYAIATGRATHDPCPDLRGALLPVTGKHFPALTDIREVAALMRTIDAFKGTYHVKAALALAPLVFVRPGELRSAKWVDINFEKAEWRYVVSKTKTDHLVPLSRQAVAILRELHPLTGHSEYLFPGRDPKKFISNSTINAALVRMGYDTKTEITGHGFRAMARTLIAEELHYPPEVIEHQLAHRVPDALGTAYNRTKYLKERKAMMQEWSDYLDKLKAGAVAGVVPFPAAV